MALAVDGEPAKRQKTALLISHENEEKELLVPKQG